VTAAYDRYVDLSCADYGAADYQELATRYHERFDGFMEDDAVSGYGQILMVAQAIEETGSTDPTDIAEYLRDTTFELPGYAWDLGWTAWGELDGASPLLVMMREQAPPEGVNPGAPWYLDVILRPEPLEPFVP
jgi:ABC-type branched-subunit amino acid transport system substrate-binding protein